MDILHAVKQFFKKITIFMAFAVKIQFHQFYVFHYILTRII